MLESNKNYFIETNSMTDFQKLEELYDMYVYFLEKNEFEKCAVIQTNITEIRSAYHKVIDERKRK